MVNMAIFIQPLTYQSQNVTISDWIGVLTLCLAPLVAHVLIGAPSPAYLSLSRPPWHERVCHYNPTSILWRYAMVADRRLRAKNWDRIDLAATNALFWTDQGWDGTEEIIQYARPRCVQLPDDDRVTLLSRDAFKTLIITVQGIQAIILLLSSQIDPGSPGFTIFMGVDIIFFPVALFGLLRLCSCIWLTQAEARSVAAMSAAGSRAYRHIGWVEAFQIWILANSTRLCDAGQPPPRFLPPSSLSLRDLGEGVLSPLLSTAITIT